MGMLWGLSSYIPRYGIKILQPCVSRRLQDRGLLLMASGKHAYRLTTLHCRLQDLRISPRVPSKHPKSPRPEPSPTPKQASQMAFNSAREFSIHRSAFYEVHGNHHVTFNLSLSAPSSTGGQLRKLSVVLEG